MAYGSRSNLIFIIVVGLAMLPGSLPAQSPEASSTLVIYNQKDPDSKKLAVYYSEQRKIPKDQIIGLDCGLTEEISRQDYEKEIAGPLRAILLKKGWWKQGGDGTVVETTMRFAVLMRGMPLKIAPVVNPSASPGTVIEPTSRNKASVDSELAVMGMQTKIMPPGPIMNPYFSRYTKVLDPGVTPGLLLVCRLDAMTPMLVRAMIDDAISVERDGLWGWSYVDARGITEGGYAVGDVWMRNLIKTMRGQGLPVISDFAPDILPAGFPVTDAAIYFGWYAGDVSGAFADPSYRFRPGAVAVHIHSYSASTLRNATIGWTGPLIARGACASLGNVYEPYLELSAHLDVFQERLMAGFTLAESAYMAQRALSWMSIVVGDPLYKPYDSWFRVNANDAETTSSSWEEYRHIILKEKGSTIAAASLLKAAAKETGKSMFLEALAGAEADDNQSTKALGTLDEAIAMEKNPAIRFRMVLETIALLRPANDKGVLRDRIQKARAEFPNPAAQELLAKILDEIFPPPPTPTPQATSKP